MPQVFVPVQPLTRALLLRVLAVVQRTLGAYDEGFTHLQQAMFEALPGAAERELDGHAEVDAVVERAKAVRTETHAFLARAGGGHAPAPAAPTDRAKGKRRAVDVESAAAAAASSSQQQPIDLRDDSDGGDGGASGTGRSRGGGGGTSGSGGGSGDGASGSSGSALAALISRSLKQRTSGDDDESLGGGAFNADGADAADECIRPSSALVRVPVCAGGGGGEMWVDDGSRALVGGSMPPGRLVQLKAAREALELAKSVVERSVPSLRPILLASVRPAYDGKNAECATRATNGAWNPRRLTRTYRRPRAPASQLPLSTHLLATRSHITSRLA